MRVREVERERVRICEIDRDALAVRDRRNLRGAVPEIESEGTRRAELREELRIGVAGCIRPADVGMQRPGWIQSVLRVEIQVVARRLREAVERIVEIREVRGSIVERGHG